MKIKMKKPREWVMISGSMTDLSFLLIIFFIIAAVFLSNQGLLLFLPEKDTEPLMLQEEEVIQITLKPEGILLLDKEPINPSNLRQEIKRLLQERKEAVVVIEIEAEVPYQDVFSILELTREAGAKTYSLVSKREIQTIEEPEPLWNLFKLLRI